ncbi:MAG TPA: sigma-70 family RNA polymerase sigma factor [Vicinamibacteria bacterium]|jgi:RNA polymerase sigma-70 factor (ECF subfamily)
MTDPVEADLVARARAGNFFAFEEIVKRHQRRVYGVAWRILRRHDLADDVTQETFIRAHRFLHDFDLGRPFGPWVCRIAANLAVNRLRSPERREEALDDRQHAAPASSGDPLAGLLEKEAQAVLDRALDELPPEQRAVFVLRVSEELSYREIAEALGLSMGTVMSRLWRARARLRHLLLPYLTEARAARGAP